MNGKKHGEPEPGPPTAVLEESVHHCVGGGEVDGGIGEGGGGDEGGEGGEGGGGEGGGGVGDDKAHPYDDWQPNPDPQQQRQ